MTLADLDATSKLEGQGKNGAAVVVVDQEGKTVGAVSLHAHSLDLRIARAEIHVLLRLT